jgi:hypothetical protein
MRKIRQIQKYGNAVVIKLKPSDLDDLEWELGDNIDISECINVSKRSEAM